jgi:hypothetical protein
MDQFRTIRVVLGPFILLGSLLLGAWLDKTVTAQKIAEIQTETLTAIVGIVAAAIVPAGWVIGGITTLALYVIHGLTTDAWDRFELGLSQEAWEQIWKKCNFKLKTARRVVKFKTAYPNKNERIWAASIWIRACVRPEIYQVTDRRYQAAVSQLNAVTAILLSYPVGLLLDVRITPQWIYWTAPLALVFVVLAFIARREASDIFELLARQDKTDIGLQNQEQAEPKEVT